MRDIQNEHDEREIPLKKVGVKGLQYPVKVLDKVHKTQLTTATADLFVNLPHHFKGTHMSRFVELFHRYHSDLSMKQFLAMLHEMTTRLDAEEAFATMRFPFFVEKNAPVSGQSGLMCYQCTYEGHVWKQTETQAAKELFRVSIEIPVTTLCPCSKAISEYGAHNQRGIVTVQLEACHMFWIEDIIQLVENCASSGVYSVLKREDEKFVTEQAYDNPRFVEDVVREVYQALCGVQYNGESVFSWFSVEAENFESIHNHSAYAYTEYSE